MAEPLKSHIASASAMSSYLAVRPISAPVSLDGVLIKPGIGTPIEYFTHKSGAISLLPEAKPIN